MSKRDDDSRDVWDKILDYLPTVGGAVAGGAVGGTIGYRIAKKTYSKSIKKAEEEAAEAYKKHIAIDDSMTNAFIKKHGFDPHTSDDGYYSMTRKQQKLVDEFHAAQAKDKAYSESKLNFFDKQRKEDAVYRKKKFLDSGLILGGTGAGAYGGAASGNKYEVKRKKKR